jgi:WD40 repeat protein
VYRTTHFPPLGPDGTFDTGLFPYIAQSPDGTRGIHSDGRVVEVATGAELFRILNTHDSLWGGTADGRFFYAPTREQSNSPVVRWDAELPDQAPVGMDVATSTTMRCVAFTPDGSAVLAAGDRVAVWRDGSQTAEVEIANPLLPPGEDITHAALSRDGNTFAVSDGRLVAIGTFDGTSELIVQQVGSFSPITYVSDLAFSPDDSKLVCGTNWGVRVLDVESGQLTAQSSGPPILTISFTEDSALIVFGTSTPSSSVQIYTWPELMPAWGTGPAEYYQAQITADGAILAAAGTATLGFWDVRLRTKLDTSSLGILPRPISGTTMCRADAMDAMICIRLGVAIRVPLDAPVFQTIRNRDAVITPTVSGQDSNGDGRIDVADLIFIQAQE